MSTLYRTYQNETIVFMQCPLPMFYLAEDREREKNVYSAPVSVLCDWYAYAWSPNDNDTMIAD